MTTAQLRTFLAVCQYMSFTEAGLALGLTSSAVSRQIATLESEVGIQLFTRRNNFILLTPAGSHFREGITQVFTDLEKIIRESSKLDLGVTGELRIGVLSDQTVEEPLCRALQDLSSDGSISVTLRRMNFRDLHREIENGHIDAGITIIQSDHFFSDWNRYVYAEEPVCLALHRRLAEGIPSPLTETDLSRLSERIPLAIPSLNNFVESQQSVLGSLPRDPTLRRTYMAIESILPMTLAGLCGALLNISNYLFRDPDIVRLDMEDLPPIEKGILWRNDNENPVLPRFIESVQQMQNGKTFPAESDAL